MPLNTGAPLAELAAVLLELEEEITAAELDDLLEETIELDEETAVELATELLLVVAPQADAVNCAPFLPTPA